MGWVKKGNSYYFYRSELINGKVKTFYVGKYPKWQDFWNHTIPNRSKPICPFSKEFLIKTDNLIKATNIVYYYCLLLTGHHLDYNGIWRKARHSLLLSGHIPEDKKKYYPRCEALHWFIENSENLLKGLKEQLDLTLKETIKVIELNYHCEIARKDLWGLDSEILILGDGSERKISELDKLFINIFNTSLIIGAYIPCHLAFKRAYKGKRTLNTPYGLFQAHRKHSRKKITKLTKLSSRGSMLLEPIETIIKTGYEKIKNFNFAPSEDELTKKLLRNLKNPKFYKFSLETIISNLKNKNTLTIR